MKWQYIQRNEAGVIEQNVIDALIDCECQRVAFWDAEQDVAVIFESEMLLMIENDLYITHYCKLEIPRNDRRRKKTD